MYSFFERCFCLQLKKTPHWHVVFNVYDKNEFIPYSSITGFFHHAREKVYTVSCAQGI